MELSKRLQAVADLISDGVSVADVGTDHGYIPIYLMKEKKSPKVIAMDVNAGPLKRAEEHIAEHGLLVETRLSDGVNALEPGEVECVVIAGMGGALTVKIMEEGKSVFRSLKEFVLQPQSELKKVREYLRTNGYCVVEENMILEDGKFYPMMKVITGQADAYHNVELCYGKGLLEMRHPVLKRFLQKEQSVKQRILQSLERKNGAHIEIRKKEIKEELEGIGYALQRYYESY